jgi:fucose 4-O-acetylase-like acetyltransferase
MTVEAALKAGRTSGARLDELAAATPPSRDRYVDFLRALSITLVVVGHWISALVGWRDGVLDARNAVGAMPGTCYVTWVLQVMPIFFFVGGFSNYKSFEGTQRRGESVLQFYRKRLIRLLMPTGVFVWFWIMVAIGLNLAGTFTSHHISSARVLFGPLWFLLVYLAIVVLTPVTCWLHRRYGAAVIVALGMLAVGVDATRFLLNLKDVGWANLVFIWVLVHQLGYLYADGTLTRIRRSGHLAMALSGLAVLFVLTSLAWYPKSMVSTGFEKASNMTPPTVCIVALTLWLVGVSMFARDWVSRWLTCPGPWKTVVAANSVIMTIYLWHITAYAVTFAVLTAVGFAGSPPGSVRWWFERSIWLVGPGLVLGLLLVVFSRFERPTPRPRSAAN